MNNFETVTDIAKVSENGIVVLKHEPYPLYPISIKGDMEKYLKKINGEQGILYFNSKARGKEVEITYTKRNITISPRYQVELETISLEKAAQLINNNKSVFYTYGIGKPVWILDKDSFPSTVTGKAIYLTPCSFLEKINNGREAKNEIKINDSFRI